MALQIILPEKDMLFEAKYYDVTFSHREVDNVVIYVHAICAKHADCWGEAVMKGTAPNVR